jgi:hypothetical protein
MLLLAYAVISFVLMRGPMARSAFVIHGHFGVISSIWTSMAFTRSYVRGRLNLAAVVLRYGAYLHGEALIWTFYI